MILSIPIILASLSLGIQTNSECENFIQFPMLVLGVFLFVISVLGIIGACCQVTFLLWIYLFVTFLLMIALFCFSIFAFVVTNKGVGEAIMGTGYKEYRLGDYSDWLQKQVNNEKNWGKIKSCLQDSEFCRRLGHQMYDGNDLYEETAEFYKQNLTPTQSGCCKPPTSCGFIYNNATYWTVPKHGVDSHDSDCQVWSNDQDRLCYDCNSCKAGVLANLKISWRKLAIMNFFALLFLNIIYSIGCCAFRNNRMDSYQPYRPYYH
ncbi:tetraspanin-8-like [Magnolia sinica]|uniref:tetraspanin-8-like n=1 Tax=Magnolia sinica TaxID=86752 RepID=UPI002659D51E|nr:tetraspanin-8-like [Magnolia sinica]